MEGGSQRSLQLFVVNGYCVFEDDVCVDLLVSKMGGLTMSTSPFQGFLLGLAQVSLRSLTRGSIMRLVFFQGSMLGLSAPLCRCSGRGVQRR